ncbi:unnamed protein product [Protopolystoma xenopodis]|uniref:Uncharacterized protein n=1 Tax=Protopolystoma xenopodis TaxID=117903 RepID=A0A448XGZ0_9PLAT|nr:unnamed protein product [Protopolystoma xenopodis]
MSCLFGLSEQEQAKACAGVGLALSPVWSWLAGAMDSLEAQLRFRAAWNRQAQQLAAYATGIQLANSNNANPLASSAASVTVDDLSQPESGVCCKFHLSLKLGISFVNIFS